MSYSAHSDHHSKAATSTDLTGTASSSDEGDSNMHDVTMQTQQQQYQRPALAGQHRYHHPARPPPPQPAAAPSQRSTSNASKNDTMQPAELSENDKFIRLTVDLPGVFARDLEVDVNHGVLSIKGVRKTMSIDNAVCIKKHKFSRRYAIDTDVVDVGNIRANLAQGVLTIKAPKKTRAQELVRIGVTENEHEELDLAGTLQQQELPPPPHTTTAPAEVLTEASSSGTTAAASASSSTSPVPTRASSNSMNNPDITVTTMQHDLTPDDGNVLGSQVEDASK